MNCCIRCKKLLEILIRHVINVYITQVISQFVKDAIAVTLELIVRGIIDHISVELEYIMSCKTIKCQVKLSKEVWNGWNEVLPILHHFIYYLYIYIYRQRERERDHTHHKYLKHETDGLAQKPSTFARPARDGWSGGKGSWTCFRHRLHPT